MAKFVLEKKSLKRRKYLKNFWLQYKAYNYVHLIKVSIYWEQFVMMNNLLEFWEI